MNYIYCIIATLSFFTLQQCFAMIENKPNAISANIIHTINTIQNPQSVVSFQGDIIAIKGYTECSIYNIAKKQEICRINNNDDIKCIAGHPTKPLLAIISENSLYQGYLRIYNVTTGDRIAELEQNNLQSPFVFNPTNDTLIVRYLWESLRVHDCKTLAEIALLPMNTPSASIIAFNPTANECAFYANKTITILNTKNNFSSTKKKKTSIEYVANTLLYSSDGSLILCNTYNKKYCILKSKLTVKAYDGKFKAIAMNPTSLILAGLSINNECIDYINTQKKGQILASTNLSSFKIGNACYEQYIQFSSDGKKIIAVGNDACYVLEVPFDALYLPGTKNKCISALWARQNYFEKNNQILPQDIKHLLIYYLLDVCKYSFTNH